MSKFTFVVCDQEYNEFTISSDTADQIYQAWCDAHPEFGPTGDKGIAEACPSGVAQAYGEDEFDYVGQHWGVLIDIGESAFGPDFFVQTYIKISVA